MIAKLVTSLSARFPEAKYGFANAISSGEIINDHKRFYLRCASPFDFFECGISSRFIIQQLREIGVEAKPLLMEIPTFNGAEQLSKTSHIVTLVQTAEGEFIAGLTQYDHLLGIYPAVKLETGTGLYRLAKEHSQALEGEEHLRDKEYIDFSLHLPEGQEMVFFNRLPLAGRRTDQMLILANLGLTTRGSNEVFINYAAQAVLLTPADNYTLFSPTNKGYIVQLTKRQFPGFIVLAGQEHDFLRFLNRLSSSRNFGSLNDISYDLSSLTQIQEQLWRMLTDNWPVVRQFLAKIAEAKSPIFS